MRGALLASACALLACAREPVAWGDVTYSDSGAAPRAVVAAALPPRAGAGCARVVLAGHTTSTFAAWWEPRPDRSAVLLAARSPDGGVTWDQPVVVDGRDASDRGCERLAPSMFADSSTGYLHLSYYLEPREGGGVYFAHSMRGSALSATGEGIFHAPVPVVFGGTPVRSGVAGRGDTVAVAFEDPNSADGRIAVSVSTGAGHIFGAYSVVSPTGTEARDPHVSLDGDSVIVSWSERARGNRGSPRLATRRGKLLLPEPR